MWILFNLKVPSCTGMIYRGTNWLMGWEIRVNSGFEARYFTKCGEVILLDLNSQDLNFKLQVKCLPLSPIERMFLCDLLKEWIISISCLEPLGNWLRIMSQRYNLSWWEKIIWYSDLVWNKEYLCLVINTSGTVTRAEL